MAPRSRRFRFSLRTLVIAVFCLAAVWTLTATCGCANVESDTHAIFCDGFQRLVCMKVVPAENEEERRWTDISSAPENVYTYWYYCDSLAPAPLLIREEVVFGRLYDVFVSVPEPEPESLVLSTCRSGFGRSRKVDGIVGVTPPCYRTVRWVLWPGLWVLSESRINLL